MNALSEYKRKLIAPQMRTFDRHLDEVKGFIWTGAFFVPGSTLLWS